MTTTKTMIFFIFFFNLEMMIGNFFLRVPSNTWSTLLTTHKRKWFVRLDIWGINGWRFLRCKPLLWRRRWLGCSERRIDGADPGRRSLTPNRIWVFGFVAVVGSRQFTPSPFDLLPLLRWRWARCDLKIKLKFKKRNLRKQVLLSTNKIMI